MTKIALITGASSGIGAATARALAKANYRLILCGRRAERLDALAMELSAITETTTLLFDVRKSKDVFEQIGSLPDAWKAIDVLVNSAGNAHGLATFQEGNIDDWDAMIDGNVKGLLYVSRAIVPGMVERKSGHIVNLSSVAGKYTYPGGLVYCASKKAVEAISEGMRLDLTQHGIRVTNVAPGAVETEFSLVRFKGDSERAKKTYEGYTPLYAEDIASAIAYAVTAPAHVNLTDMLIYPSAQAAPGMIYKKG